MNASFNHVSLSNTVNCAQCQQSLSTCKCAPSTFTSNVTSFTTANLNSSYTPHHMTCSGCGNVFTACSCFQYNKYTIQPSTNPIYVPITSPTPWQYTTTTHTIFDTTQKISDFLIRDIQTPTEYKTSGLLRVIEFNKENGLYIKAENLEMPLEYKDCFYSLRNSASHKLWQLRSPLSFRIDLAHLDDQEKKPHFFTLFDIEDCLIEKDTIQLTTLFLQEITDQLELIRLVEIQDTFTKLLRRL